MYLGGITNLEDLGCYHLNPKLEDFGYHGLCQLLILDYNLFYSPIMQHYVKKLGEKFLLPLQYFLLFGRVVPGHTKTFMRWEAMGNGGLKCLT